MIDRDLFPVDSWRLVETQYPHVSPGVSETLLGLGNGYLGLRGNHIEGRGALEHGTFINGLHETWKIRHAEQAFGFAEVGQTIVNAPDAKVMRHGSRLQITLTADRLLVEVREGDPVSFSVRGTAHSASVDSPAAVPLPDQGPVLHGRPEFGRQARHEDGTILSPTVPTT